jgi:hypothetical protein
VVPGAPGALPVAVPPPRGRKPLVPRSAKTRGSRNVFPRGSSGRTSSSREAGERVLEAVVRDSRLRQTRRTGALRQTATANLVSPDITVLAAVAAAESRRSARSVNVDGARLLKAVGYWRPSEGALRYRRQHGYGGKWFSPAEIAACPEAPPNPLPNPACLVWKGWSPTELPGVLAYLRAGQEWIQFCGWSYCRFDCGIAPSALGDRDLTDGVWVWPEGLAHYVEAHSVRLPDEFIDHMRSLRWRVSPERITRWVDRAEAERPHLDGTFWIEWARRVSAAIPAEASAGGDPARESASGSSSLSGVVVGGRPCLRQLFRGDGRSVRSATLSGGRKRLAVTAYPGTKRGGNRV